MLYSIITNPIKKNSFNVKIVQKLFLILGYSFANPKDRIAKEQRKDAIYSIPRNDCNLEYIDQTNVLIDLKMWTAILVTQKIIQQCQFAMPVKSWQK